MKTFKIFLGFTLMSLFLLPGLALAEQGKKPKITATVNGKEILMSEVNLLVDRSLKRATARKRKITPKLKKNIRKRWIERLITKELLLQQSIAGGVTVSDSDVENSLAAANQHGMGVPTDKLKQLIRDNMMIDKIIEERVLSKIVITDQKVENLYNTRKNDFKTPEQVNARHILIKVKHFDSQEKKDESRKKIESILAKAREGKEDFGELAKKFSEGPSNSTGGSLGYFSRGKMVPSFEKAAFALKVGEISDVVETQFGYHIIKVEDKKEAQVREFDEVKNLIRENLKRQQSNQKVNAWVTELRNKATIEILE